MMEKHNDIYIPVCDGCGTELPEEYEFKDAVGAMKAAGWSFISPDFSVHGDWEHYCPACAEKWRGAAKK